MNTIEQDLGQRFKPARISDAGLIEGDSDDPDEAWGWISLEDYPTLGHAWWFVASWDPHEEGVEQFYGERNGSLVIGSWFPAVFFADIPFRDKWEPERCHLISAQGELAVLESRPVHLHPVGDERYEVCSSGDEGALPYWGYWRLTSPHRTTFETYKRRYDTGLSLADVAARF